MPVIASRFRPAWWLRGDHAQTLWPAFFRRRPALGIRWERLELDDGDFLDLAWSGPADAPVTITVFIFSRTSGPGSTLIVSRSLPVPPAGWYPVRAAGAQRRFYV